VNNAGIQKPAPSHEIELHDFDAVVGMNLRGAFLCSREAIRHFLARGTPGVIVNNSGVHEIIPKPKYLPYLSAKVAWRISPRALRWSMRAVAFE
jgi:glucose 1-dehydrogenase